jgi:hypothetical protein
MNSVKLRSPRDPKFWLPLLVSLALILPLGYFAHLWVTKLVERLDLLAQADPRAALEEAVYWLRRATWIFCALLAVFCIYFLRFCQLGRREGRLPPSGWWSYGALHALVGEKARRVALCGQWIAGFLLAAAPGLALAVEYLARLILAGEFAS